MAGAPTLVDLKLWLSLEDSADDNVLAESLAAALSAQAIVCVYPTDLFGDVDFSDDLRVAIYLRATRYASRRNSPEGIVGLAGVGGDFVSARLASYDTDVLHLESPHRRLVVS